MLTSDELKVLRGRGEKDADILKKYREFDPESAGDIETLLKRGESPTKVLDGLAEFYGSDSAPKESKPDPMADKGIGAKVMGALQFGGANLARGLAKTAKTAGLQKTGDYLEKGAKSIEPAPGTYDPAGARFDITDPGTYGYAPRALLEGAPGVAADLTAGAAGTAVGGPLGGIAAFGASNAARNFGGNLEARMEHQAPGSQPSTSDYLAAGASTAAEAALARVGINPAISSVAKGAGLKAMAQVPGLIAKAAGAEAASGAAGDIINQVGRTAGTRDGLSVDPKEAANSAALSGMTGGAIRAARGVSDITNAGRFAGIDEGAAARAVSRMDATGIDPSNAKKAFERVEMARKTGDAELNDAHQVLKPLLKSKGNDTDLDATRTLVKTTMTQLKANGEVDPQHLTSLRDRLGDTQEGSRLLDLMEERNALNQMASKGRYDAKEGTFAGGAAANPTVDSLLNPKHYLGAKLIGGAGVAGVAELPMFAQIGVLGPALAKLAAAQAGTYAGVRALDRVTGLRNPAQEFSERFRGMQVAPGEDLPSFRQDAVDQATQAQSDKAAFRDNSTDLKQTVKAAEAAKKLRETTQATRTKQEEAAWRAKASQEAQDARKAEQADKAWETREQPPEARQAQEEAMWRQNDANALKAAEEDATAQAGIHAGYSEMLKQAVLSGQASKKLREVQGKQTDTAWTQKGRQDAAQTRLEATVNRDFGRAEAQRNARSPEAIKAAQEEAMWRDQEAQGGPVDWSDQDAISAIQREISARQKASEFLVRQSQKDAQAPQTEEGVPEALKVRVRARTKAEKAPEAQTEANPETITIRHGDQVVERAVDGIRNQSAYVAKTKQRMADRQSFVDDILEETGKRQRPITDAMLTKLNNVARSWKEAQSIIEDYVNELPEKHWGKAWDAYNKHEGKLRGSYGE